MTLRGAWSFDHAYYGTAETPQLNPVPWHVYGGAPGKAGSPLDSSLWWASASYSPLAFSTSGATNPFDAIRTVDTGTANAAVTTTDTTLTDTRKAWTTDQWVNAVVTCNGKTMTVTSNTATTLTGTAWSGGGNPGNGFAYSVGGKCWFYFPFKATTVPNNGDQTDVFWGQGDPNVGLPAGAVVLYVVENTANNKYGFGLGVYNGGYNTTVEAATTRSKDTTYWLCIEVDWTASPKTIKLFVDGSGTASITHSGPTATPIVGMPRLGNNHVSGKGTGIVFITAEIIINDSDGTENNAKFTYTSAASSTHCISAYGISDVAGGDFAAQGLNCGTDKFRAICDPAFVNVQANDYINVTPDAAAKSQWFNVDDMDSGATVRGVYICAASKATASPDYMVDKLLLKEGAGSEQVIAGVKNWASGTSSIRYSYRATPPTSASWIETPPSSIFSSITAGVRTDAGSTDERRVEGFHLGVVGENLARVAQKTCPAASAFVPRVIIC